MESKSKVLVVILVIVALGLGYAIYAKKYAKTAVPSEQTGNQNTQTNNNQQNTQTQPKELTADEKIIFSNPGPNTSKEDLALFSSTIAKLAVPGDTVTVNNCTATPQVLKMKYGSKFTVKNAGTAEIHFGFGTDRTLIAPGASAQLTANYKNGAGIYGFGCDDKSLNRAIGILLLTKE